MIINRWRIEAIVREESGLTVHDLARHLGVGYRTALRHARRHTSIVIEPAKGGRGAPALLWWKYDLPAHLAESATVKPNRSVNTRPRYYTLDEL